MKKYTYKFITGLALVFAFALSFGVASAYFNDSSIPPPAEPDLPTVMVRNRTVEGACTTGCQWHTSVQANAGDTISVQLYYHNTSYGSTASNTRVRISQPSGTASNFTLTGSVYASGVPPATSSVGIAINGGAQSLTFSPGSVLWYANKPLANFPLLASETDILSYNGLTIGDVAPYSVCAAPGPYQYDAFCKRGFVTLQFKVGTTAPPVDLCTNITGTQTTVPAGYYQSGTECFPVAVDLCSNITGVQATIPAGYYQSGNACYPIPVDVCTNISGNQATVPYGYYQSGTECFPVAVDLCSNLTGVQTTIPYGYYQSGNACYPNQVDVCSNLSGVQTTVPYGYYQDGTACYPNPTDVCSNIVGVQTTVPYGYYQSGTQCFPNAVDVCSNIDGIQTTVPYGYYQSGTQCYPTQTDVCSNIDGVQTTVPYGYYQSGNQCFPNQPTTYACNDGLDNDGDGSIDMNDPGCSSYYDTDEYNYVQQSTLSAITAVATNVTQTTARLNGVVFTGGTNATSWFEWGSTQALGNTTAHQSIGNVATVPVADNISGLTANRTYYFRIVAQSNGYYTTSCPGGYCNGMAYGDIRSFTTTTIPTQIIYTNNGNTGNSLVQLTIDSRFESIRIDDVIEYTVTYKNITQNTIFKDAIIQILLPEHVEFVRTSEGIYNAADNTITNQVGILQPGVEGIFYFEGRVKTIAKENELLVTTATLAFKNVGNALDTVIAYETNTVVKDTNNLLTGIALFGADGIFPNSLVGWLLLILILLALIYMGRKIMKAPSGPVVMNQMPPRPYSAPVAPAPMSSHDAHH